LDQGPFTDNAQTVDKCLARCTSGGYLYAGVEYGVECFCSQMLKSGAVQKPETECSKPCAGNRLLDFSECFAGN
jgi:glucan endo-1,3-alpha-glucosidase